MVDSVIERRREGQPTARVLRFAVARVVGCAVHTFYGHRIRLDFRKCLSPCVLDKPGFWQFCVWNGTG
jgi:hypothetical protein